MVHALSTQLRNVTWLASILLGEHHWIEIFLKERGRERADSAVANGNPNILGRALS
jgi:hypothetical protein